MREPEEIVAIACTVNAQPVHAQVSARQHLADFLRDHLELKGTHLGCEHGVCGSCTVMLDQQPVRGCLVLAAQADGARIETIEGAVQSHRVTDLVDAFVERNAAQCGFCSPAMILSAAHLLEHHPDPSRAEVREHLSGNYCRCTGYEAIVDAVMHTAALRRQNRGQGI
jgi:carbon-monoxide dehydrogenase small subunit